MVLTGEEAKDGTNQKRVFILQRLTDRRPAAPWPALGPRGHRRPPPASSPVRCKGEGRRHRPRRRCPLRTFAESGRGAERQGGLMGRRRWAPRPRPRHLPASPRHADSKISKQQSTNKQKNNEMLLSPSACQVSFLRTFCFVFKATNLENNFGNFFPFVFLFSCIFFLNNRYL